jgi:membrane protease YdiL (CAAX protease family)
MRDQPWRFWLCFLLLLACYQAAEGIGMRFLNSPFWQGVLMVAVLPLALILGAALLTGPLRAYALERRAGAGAWLLRMFAMALLGKFIAIAIGLGSGIYALEMRGVALSAAAIAMALLVTFVPSIAEDLLTRGLWFRHGPLRALGGGGFVALSTVVYVLNHVYRLADGPLAWLMLACFGAAYAFALVRSGTLWAAVGLHWGWNAANALVDIFVEVNVLRAGAALLLSAAAHLALAGGCLLSGATSDSNRQAGNLPA